MTDTSLLLRTKYHSGDRLPPREALELLAESKLVRKLTTKECKTPLARVWRLIALSEIPYAGHLAYTKSLVRDVEQEMFTGEAFSLTGKPDDVLPCYNAMIARALLRISGPTKFVEAAITWIGKYQPMCRGSLSNWRGKATRSYGGCFKTTPCYIGVVKSLAALRASAVAAHSTGTDSKLKQGLQYILEHELVFRQSNGEPILRHIRDISFPESYQLNIVEVVQLVSQLAPDVLSEQRAVQHLLSMRSAEGFWKISYV